MLSVKQGLEMAKLKIITLVVGFGALALSGTFTPASARCSSGEIANFLCRTGVISQQTAQTADAAHAGMGRPLDHLANQAAGAAANYVVPGSGPYVTEGLELRDQYNRMGNGPVAPAPQLGYAPQVAMQPPPMGNHCLTGRGMGFLPFFQPLGSSCQVATPWGAIDIGITQ